MIPQKETNKNRFSIGFAIIGFLSGLLLSCQSKSTGTNDAESADSTAQADAPRDSIISFEALFVPGQYDAFLGEYWSEGCHNYSYPIEKALSRQLDCPCTGIFPTIANGSIVISLNNVYCFPPEVEEMNYRPDYHITLPLDSLRPYLSEAGVRIVFESGTYLQDWLANQKKLASVVEPSPYTLYVSLKEAGKNFFRMVLQSKEGPNNQETISGYYEMSDGTKSDVIGYRTWGGFVVYERTKDSSSGIEFYWDDEAQGEMAHQVQNRYLTASSPAGEAYIEYVKLVGAFTSYEGPEDEPLEPENGVPE